MMTTMELKWIKATPETLTKPQRPSSLPIYISTRPSHVIPDDLRRLYAACDLSGHRFPAGPPVDHRKLRLALSHSAFVVSVFSRRVADATWRTALDPVGPHNGDLVGFGRAVSDLGLTASIYDVMVVPSLRGLGIGRLIVQRIVRPFFEACGFGDDILGSTTMMYTRSVSAGLEATNQKVTSAGRKLLLIPPLKTPLRVKNP